MVTNWFVYKIVFQSNFPTDGTNSKKSFNAEYALLKEPTTKVMTILFPFSSFEMKIPKGYQQNTHFP